MLREGKYEAVGELYKPGITDRLLDRSLYVVRVDGLYYREKLAPAERERFEDYYRRLGEALRRVGLRTKVIGLDYDKKDYFDRSHLSEKGGEKLAGELAPEIRAMAERLYGAAGGK
jgi:hypothetical protein